MAQKIDLRSAKLNIAVETGKTWSMHVAMPAGWSWTGYALTWVVRAEGAATPAVTATVGDGLTLSAEAFDVLVSSTDTDIAVGNYLHEFQLIDPSGENRPFIEGVLVVS